MCLAFNREAVDLTTASYKVLFSHPVREASIVSLMDEFEKLKPRNDDSRKREAFDKLIHTAMAGPTNWSETSGMSSHSMI